MSPKNGAREMRAPWCDVPGSEAWQAVTRLAEGYSDDEVYLVQFPRGERVLRLSPASAQARKRAEFEAMARVRALGVLGSEPIALGVCDGGARVYQLLSFVPGEKIEHALPGLPEQTQYRLGLAAGRSLARIHSLPAPPDPPDWEARFNAKIDRKIALHRDSGVHYPGEDRFLDYLNRNRSLLKGRPQCFQHGDYHCGNLILTPEGQVGVIDYNRLDYGDPWEEFNRIVWCAQVSPAFASGRIDGYFDGPPPELFFQLMALYIASNQLASVAWAVPFGQDEVDIMLAQNQFVLDGYRGFETVVPAWYHGA